MTPTLWLCLGIIIYTFYIYSLRRRIARLEGELTFARWGAAHYWFLCKALATNRIRPIIIARPFGGIITTSDPKILTDALDSIALNLQPVPDYATEEVSHVI